MAKLRLITPPILLWYFANFGTLSHRRPTNTADIVVRAARQQIGTIYYTGYFRIPYPNGDLPKDRGVCTDVVVRALRAANLDLQLLIHADMKKNFEKYPNLWGLRKPDSNIDHRRVPNQMRFFDRHGKKLTLGTQLSDLAQWKAADFVYWRLDNGLLHCGVVSDKKNANDIPLVIHNLSGCAEEDCLTNWKIIGHYRYP